MALCFKHDAFSEEQEWRLVIVPRDTQRVEVRISGGRLLPYVSVPIVDPSEPPPYESITHGPTMEVENTQKAIKILLGAANPNYWSTITVSGSDAPLRYR
jgi:hypothetical protein